MLCSAGSALLPSFLSLCSSFLSSPRRCQSQGQPSLKCGPADTGTVMQSSCSPAQQATLGLLQPTKALQMPGFADPWASQSCQSAGSALPCAGTVLGFAWLENDAETSPAQITLQVVFSFWAWIFFWFRGSLTCSLDQSPWSGCGLLGTDSPRTDNGGVDSALHKMAPKRHSRWQV